MPLIKIVIAAVIAFSLSLPVSAQTPPSADELAQRMTERRAVEAVVWGMPAVNFELMLQAALKAGAGPNQIVYWSRPYDWKNQTLTPNPDTIYVMPFIDMRDAGPMVLEIPPAEGGAIVGSIDDVWQMPLADVGVAGIDKGQGGKYLILPPNHTGEVPDGYIVLPSATFQNYALLRSNIADASAAGVAKAAEYARRIKLYPLAQANKPPATRFVDAVDHLFDATIPYDVRFFESLNRIVQAEPWLERDKAMIDMLKSVGIEKGQPFAPDERRARILGQAAAEARDWIEARYVAGFSAKFNPGARWAMPIFPEFIPDAQAGYTRPDAYPVDARGVTYAFAFFAPKQLGTGQFYMLTIHDKDGNDLQGGNTYRLRIPANPPVRQYWSVVAYDRATHALIRDMPRSSRASNMPDLQKNQDGTLDIWFGPKAPAGKESNWVPTQADGAFELLFRFYGPQQPLFDKSWVLPDLEKVQ
ncbi:hypothetical protein D9M68_171490 [compost metagenome]